MERALDTQATDMRRAGKRLGVVGFYWPVFLAILTGKGLVFSLVVFFKYGMLSFLNLGGGSDGDYYDAFARGEAEVATSLWPLLLRALNQVGLYSREGVSFALFLIGSIAIPWLVGRLVAGGIPKGRAVVQGAWLAAILVSLYPTLFLFTLDIYRDVFMAFLFLVAVLAFQKASYSFSRIRKLIWFIVYLSVAVVLFFLRPYLGFSIVVAWPLASLLWRVKLSLWKVLILSIIYLAGLYAGHHLGIFSPLYEYRGPEGFEEGGSSFGIALHGSGLAFISGFTASFLFQVFGLYLNSAKAFALFLTESIPFIVALTSIWKRRLFIDGFSRYLIAFSLVYATIFVLGNDNLGTAARLRMFVYISALIVWIRVYLQHLRFYSKGTGRI